MFLLDAQALRMNAAVYESYANQFKAMAASYKSFANTYMSLANQFAGTAFSAVYRNLSNAYNTYSRNYANLANNYLNTATNYKNQVAIYSSYENYVSYYTDLANNAITEATAAQQVADQYSKKAEQGNIVNEAYQEILADSEYNYFYKVLKQDSFNRVTQYLSGNGLITTKEYDNAGALNHIATGYNFDDSIRDLNFEYDKVANVTKREDNKLGVTQTYQYDNLNRIVTANSFTQDNTTQMNYAYDSIGNMTYKSDIGDYNYNNQSPHQVIQAGEKNFSGFTISISGFTIGGYGYGYNDYFMQQQRAQIRAAQASANAQARANAQAVAAAWQRILQAQAQNAAQAQATAQATAAQQTQLQQNLNYQSVSSNSSHLAAGGFIRFQPTNQVPDLDHHDILTAFSVIPVVGGIAGTIDALSYAYEGDYSTAATMLAVGFIPGGKLGMKIVGKGFSASKKVGTKAEDFFANTSYSSKVKKQMNTGDFHAFPENVHFFQDVGRVSKIKGGDDKIYEMLEIPGGYKGYDGTFEFIKDSDGLINHRFFNIRNK